MSDLDVPIYVAATGPKMLELAGRIADGVILMNGIAPELIREAVRIVREGERDRGPRRRVASRSPYGPRAIRAIMP